MSGITIRNYKSEDAPALAGIYAHYVRTSVATFDFDPPALDATIAKYGAMQDKGHPVIVVEQEGEVIGYAYASDYRPRPGYRFTCEDTIYLREGHTGKGLGSRLLAEIITRARACGFHQMIGIIAGDVDASVRLHEKHGFERLGTFPKLGHKFDRWIDIVHMQREL
jgi:phosphinothricin acetyltransferase